jgi:hypothetical protein
MSDTRSCAERINEELAQRNAQLRLVMDNPDHDDYFDDPALGIDSYTLTKVCFSYGGPSDYLEIQHKGLEVFGMTYRFSDWYDTAEIQVVGGSPLYDYGLSLLESLES